MRFYQPVQLDNQRWEFACVYGNFVYPLGYCAGWHDQADESLLKLVGLEQVIERVRPFRHKFHDDGHDSPFQAATCYRDYLLDTALKLGASAQKGGANCMRCGKPTDMAAKVLPRFGYFPLCHKHMRREDVEKLFLGSSYLMV